MTLSIYFMYFPCEKSFAIKKTTLFLYMCGGIYNLKREQCTDFGSNKGWGLMIKKNMFVLFYFCFFLFIA